MTIGRRPPRFKKLYTTPRFLGGLGIGLITGAIGAISIIDSNLSKHQDDTDDAADSSKSKERLEHPALRYGIPSSSSLQLRSDYVVSYDFRTRNPSWVLECIKKDKPQSNTEVQRSLATFKADPQIPENFRVHPNKFKNSGYDRGHLAPARNMTTSQKSMDESFLMTNISPQVGGGFNRAYWSRFEGFVRHIANLYDGAFVVTGPLYLPKRKRKSEEFVVQYPVIGKPPDTIAVPTHFFKVILVRKNDDTFASAGFILPNRHIAPDTALREFLTPVDVIEKYSGLHFFEKLRQGDESDLCTETKCVLLENYKRTKKKSTENAKLKAV
uniref:Mitochondrial nuclease putative n=1 Tax=Albugo laibachii Nc14 TaxID=890382 RepID=F0W5W8_9STRA|nr:Mitochondrial nuclease putative [Albugo laibachii Nc14]|eukprot:CCA16509.1 Mitochondrial nuclease putative [Albugo laibachii Nc14]